MSPPLGRLAQNPTPTAAGLPTRPSHPLHRRWSWPREKPQAADGGSRGSLPSHIPLGEAGHPRRRGPPPRSELLSRRRGRSEAADGALAVW